MNCVKTPEGAALGGVEALGAERLPPWMGLWVISQSYQGPGREGESNGGVGTVPSFRSVLQSLPPALTSVNPPFPLLHEVAP